MNVVSIREGGGEPIPMWVLKKEMTVEARMRIMTAMTVWTMRRPRIRSKEKEGVEDMAVVTAAAVLMRAFELGDSVILRLSVRD